MTTVKTCLAQKPQPVVLVTAGPDDKVSTALLSMRDKRVRAVLVMDAGRLLGIVTQGDCAIKVLLPGLDARQVAVRDIMTSSPMTVRPGDPIEACMGLMATRNFRHLPVLDGDLVVGVVSIGDVVKESIRQMGQQIDFLETYIKGHGA
ncbi:MAG: CBS domain-containing protein [Aquabacterium sp.]|nr:CBS domain-containing protein [Aquabacterium sp.]